MGAKQKCQQNTMVAGTETITLIAQIHHGRSTPWIGDNFIPPLMTGILILGKETLLLCQQSTQNAKPELTVHLAGAVHSLPNDFSSKFISLGTVLYSTS